LSPNSNNKTHELSLNFILSQHRGRTPASDAVFSFGGLAASISVAAQQQQQLPIGIRGGARAQFNLPPPTIELSPPPIPLQTPTATTEDNSDEPVTQNLMLRR
jgi:hypothetical protein